MKVITNYLLSLVVKYRRHRLAKETINELSRLTNKELNDIGLARGDIWHLAHEDAEKRVPDVNPKVEVGVTNPNLRGFV